MANWMKIIVCAVIGACVADVGHHWLSSSETVALGVVATIVALKAWRLG